MNNLITASGGGINWTWFCEFFITENGEAFITKHWRMHNDHHSTHPKCQGGFYIKEDKERTATELTYVSARLTFTYKVANPKYVFDYK